MTGVATSIGELKEPKYTGENRCMPCTVVNELIALAGSGLVAVGVFYATNSLPWTAGAGVLTLLASSFLVYLRGYLVPGTPELTKQYFPPWLLGLFGKEPGIRQSASDPTDVDPETLLVELGALEECEDGDDLCLQPDFQAKWSAKMTELDGDDALVREFIHFFDLDQADSEFVDHGDAVQLQVDGTIQGTWESRAAVTADAAAAELLADRDAAWQQRSVGDRSALLSGLRLFLESCPECGEQLSFGAETVESCCTTHEIYALECPDCSSRLLESGPMG